MRCMNPEPHGPHQYLADADAVTMSPCAGALSPGRPSIGLWALGVASAVSSRGECTRRRVGAVILDVRGRICGAGYNGAAPGAPSCLDGACPRALSGVPAGSSYDTGPGACIAVHAELNALLDVSDRSRLDGATLYVTAEPCDGCLKILGNTEIDAVVYLDEEGNDHVRLLPAGT
ncbi:deoxycytidylate deaminase [Streptomyces phage Dagobah]|nr:deoxycytidylate deaminase [Streptomyces phage Dagobah]